jgi:hypothetical protein
MSLLKKLLPDERLDSVYDLDFERLRALGIRGIIFDLDNTLGPWGFRELDERTREWLKRVEAEGFRSAFLSNDGGEGRLVDLTGYPVLFDAGKPRSAGFRRLLGEIGLPPHEVAMVGDQLFTDVLGAKRLGLYAILVRPVAPSREGPSVRFRRRLERLILRLGGASGSESETQRESEPGVQRGLIERRQPDEER